MIKLPTDAELEQINRDSDNRIRADLKAKGVDYDNLAPMSDDELNNAEVQETINAAIDSVVAEELGDKFDAELETMVNSEEYKKMMDYINDPNISLEESHKRLCEFYPDCATM